jgi:hypothetical protein
MRNATHGRLTVPGLLQDSYSSGIGQIDDDELYPNSTHCTKYPFILPQLSPFLVELEVIAMYHRYQVS